MPAQTNKTEWHGIELDFAPVSTEAGNRLLDALRQVVKAGRAYYGASGILGEHLAAAVCDALSDLRPVDEERGELEPANVADTRAQRELEGAFSNPSRYV